MLSAQSTSATYIPDINGSLKPAGEVTSAGGVVTDLRQSINGREVPLEQVEAKVLSENGNTKVTERIVRHYGSNGQVVQTDRVVTEETKTGEGESIVRSTTFRTDLSGNMPAAERKTVETHKNGAVTVTDTSIERVNLDSTLAVAEKRTLTSEATGDGKRESETLYLRNTNGSLYEAQRSSTVETKSENQTISNTAVYEPGVNGNFALTRQQVLKSTANPDGTSTDEVEVFGRASDGRAYAAGTPPTLTEKRTTERQKVAGGAIVEKQTVQLPSVNHPSQLDSPRKVLETICRGECGQKP
jgi:hypothetical protein